MRNKNLILYTDEVDPFNPRNRITCDLTTESGPNYGSFRIRTVNGEPAPQPTIIGTPKLYYPFNKAHKYQFPSATEIRAYEKYDGTNVTLIKYTDSKGNPFITFKVRLFPFLRGHFIPKWKRILAMYPNIRKLFVMNPNIQAFSFELFGSDNTHLIKYDEKLDIRLLFGIKHGWDENDVRYATPEEIATGGIVPQATHHATINGDYVWHYEQHQKAMDTRLKPVENEDGRQLFEGSEGSIWYLKEKETGNWRMFKCKPHQIELIHWDSEHIPSTICYATAQNVLEIQDDVTLEAVESLLLEEFSQEKVDASRYRIEKAVHEIQFQVTLNRKVDSVLESELPTDTNDKATIMRTLSKHFDRSDMRKVYNRVAEVRDV